MSFVLPLLLLFPKRPLCIAPAPLVAEDLRLLRNAWPPLSRNVDENDDGVLLFSLISLPCDISLAAVDCRSSDRCRIFELIISLKDLSFSDRRGAVFKELYVCGLSGSCNLLFWEPSRGLCSSRIDLVRLSRLKGFGLFFFEVKDAGGVSAEPREALDFEVPTGLLATDLLSTRGPICTGTS